MKHRKTRLSWSTAICIVLFIVSFLIISCNRDNPFDIYSSNYLPGTPPHVHFLDSLITGYLQDSVKIPITWEDTAIGGKNGAIKLFFIDWNGDGEFSDSISGLETATIIISKVFNTQSNIIRIKAVDFEGETSAIDSAWLTIKNSTPVITSINAPVIPATVETGVPFTITVNSTDTGAVVAQYLWAIDEKEYSRTTDSGSITLSFNQAGTKTIMVKVRDSKKIESAAQIVKILVTDPSDTVGPKIEFLSPLSVDTLSSGNCVVSLQAADVGGVTGVTLNDNVAMQLFGSTWRGTITLNEGENVISAAAVDKNGNRNVADIKVYYSPADFDQTPPVMALLAPNDWTDTVNTDTLIVKLLARDESGTAGIFLDSVRMSLDTADTSYSTVSKLQEGLNRFVVRSVDVKGNIGLNPLHVFYKKEAVDTVAPMIVINKPIALQHIADSAVFISGTITDASQILSVKVNGAEAVFNYPSFSATCHLKKGKDTISVMATDKSINRNSSEKSVIVIRNQPPVFTEVPHDTFVVFNTSVSFSAVATDDDISPVFSLTRTPVTFGTVTSLVSNMSKTSFTYTAGNVGVDTFKLTAADSWGDADTTRWRVVVLAASDSTPIITTDPASLPGAVTALDTCSAVISAYEPHSRPLVYSIVNPAPSGIVIDGITGKVTWVPAQADTGAAVIIISASNGRQSDSIIWHITVFSRDLPPVFHFPGNQGVNENQNLKFTLNATDPNNDLLEFSFGSTFPYGAQLDSNKFSWTPSLSSSGEHKVEFIVRERSRRPSLCDTQTITITVYNTNQKPLLSNPGTISGVVNQVMSYTLTASDPDNDSIRYGMINGPAGSTISADRFSWTPSFSDAGTQYVKFTASDASLSDTITVAVRVSSFNSAPVLVNPGNKSISENQRLQFTLAASDQNGDSLIYSAGNTPSGSVFDGNVFSWRPDYTQTGVYYVKFYVRDNVLPSLSDSQTVAITVNNVNAPPVLTSPGNQIVNESAQLAFNLTATDADDNSLVFTMGSAPSGTSLISGHFTWTPTYTQAGVYPVTFYVSDNILRDSQTINITVNNVNRAPVFTDSSAKSISENQPFSFQLMTNDPDGNTLRYLSPDLPAGAVLTAEGVFGWTPNYTQAGSCVVTFIVQDNSNLSAILSDTARITLNVLNVNRPPVFTDSTARTVYETQLISFELQADDPDGNPVRYIAANLPEGAVLTLSGAFSWIPDIQDAAIYNIEFVAIDSSVSAAVLMDTAVVRITVANTIPGLPVPVYPDDNVSAQPKTVTFKWSRSANASEGYFLQVARDAGFSDLFFQDSTLTDTVKTVSGLSNGTAYFWRVSAQNSGSRSGWTTSRKLSTIPVFELSVNAANGSVAVSPSQGPFDSGTVVTLTANPAADYHFTNWSGDAAGVDLSASVIMNSAKNVTANFAINTYQLTVTAAAGGVIIAPAGTFPQSVNHGIETPIAAGANTGYNFVNWTVISGNPAIEDPTDFNTKVTLTTGDAEVQANFAIQTYTVTFTEGSGGTISGTKVQTVAYGGSSTEVTAVAGTDSTFTGWSGDYTGTVNPLTITNVVSDMTITANFDIKRYTVTFIEGPGGTIGGTKVQTVAHGDSCTTVTAVAGTDSTFTFWTGGYNGSDNPLTITNVTSDLIVTANFVLTQQE